MATPEECPNCGSDFIGVDPVTHVWVCFDCGYRIALSGTPVINPFLHMGH